MKRLSIAFFLCCTQFWSTAQWTQLNSGTTTSLMDVFFINSDTGFAVGHEFSNNTGIVLKTTDGGLTWSSINYGFQKNVYGVFFVNDQVGFICGKGFISKTTDQGDTWNMVSNGDLFKQIQFLNEDVGYALDSEDSRFLKTIDGGQTWNELLYPFEQIYDFCFSSEDTAMVADLDDEYEVSSTFDGGLTWNQSLIGGVYGNSFACVTHIENQTWLAIRNYNAIYADITIDAGQTWTDILMDSVPPQPNVSLPFKDVKFPTATDGWAVGSNYIINSQDGGYTWAVTDTTPDSLIKVFFPNPQVGYAVGYHGVIMKYENIAGCSANFSLVADSLVPHHYWGVNSSEGIPPLSYYWNWGDGSYDSVPYPSHVYAAGGFYTICLTIHDSIGCTNSSCYSYQIQKMSSADAGNTIVYVDIVADIPTAAQNPEEQQQLLVFPNPAVNQLNIDLSQFTEPVSSLRITDVAGKTLMEMNIENGNQKMQMDVSGFENGMYLIAVLEASHQILGKFQVLK